LRESPLGDERGNLPREFGLRERLRWTRVPENLEHVAASGDEVLPRYGLLPVPTDLDGWLRRLLDQ
jgi:hypothetical protein